MGYVRGADAVAARDELPAELFGEGICRAGDSPWQLSWQERVALRWDAATLEQSEKVGHRPRGVRSAYGGR